MRENAAVKGRRLLTEARLNIVHVDGDVIRATCRGDSGELYTLAHNGNGWSCTCPAKTTCSHLVALMLVTTRKPA